MEKFLLLGASRGLGWVTYKLLSKTYGDARFYLVSRRISAKKSEIEPVRTQWIDQDFSKTPVDLEFYNRIVQFQPTRVIYFAGGGPYGLFQQKKWSDHEWALKTSFLYPAELTHLILAQPEKWGSLKNLMLVGSAIAEDRPDPKAASYSAAKHALKGLVDSINAEQKAYFKLDLFSPPYMQTEMLPANSHPRLTDQAEDPLVVARRLIEYILKVP